MRVVVTLTDEFGDYGERLHETKVTEDNDGKIESVLLTVVKALMGCGFTEDLIKQYINYSSDNYEICKIEN